MGDPLLSGISTGTSREDTSETPSGEVQVNFR